MQHVKYFQKRSKRDGPSGNTATRGNIFLRLIVGQLPVVIAILAALIVAQAAGGYGSDGYSLVVLLLLMAVVYTALYRGARQGLISAVLAVSYNTYIFSGLVQIFSLADGSLRSILLLGIVLPALAVIVGRLKERSDYFLARETSARIRAEESEQRLRFMAESMPQKIFTFKPNGENDYFNPQWIEFSGLNLEQMHSKGWEQLIHPDDLDENVRRWQHSLDTGQPFQFQHRLKRADGAYRWHLSRAEAMRNEKENIVLWVGSSTDIEDVRRTRKLEASTARLTEQRAQLLTLNKAKDEFISLASHQLRTPATGVKQYVGMLLEGYGGKVTQQQRSMLTHAYESNERQLAIVDDLLKVAQLDAGKVQLQKEKVNVVVLLRNVLHEQASKFAERKQTVIFTPGRRAITAVIDSHRMRMVLENIIDNASKYTPAHKHIEVSLSKTNQIVTIIVKDEGVGIDQKDIKKIFHKFSRLDNPLSVSVGGSGLGLYWVEKIVDLHGGSVEVESEADKGSTFTVKVPA